MKLTAEVAHASPPPLNFFFSTLYKWSVVLANLQKPPKSKMFITLVIEKKRWEVLLKSETVKNLN